MTWSLAGGEQEDAGAKAFKHVRSWHHVRACDGAKGTCGAPPPDHLPRNPRVSLGFIVEG